MQHRFVAYVEDKPGVLTRVASLFRRLNINIVSVTVGLSERPNVSRMTLVADAPPASGPRIMASLYKLENVLEVDDIAGFSSVSRELALIKVAATPKTRSHLFELVEVFRARVVDLAPDSMMIEITGTESKLEGLLQVLNESEDKVLEISRTGQMVMRRGHHTGRVLRAMGDTDMLNTVSQDTGAAGASSTDSPRENDPSSMEEELDGLQNDPHSPQQRT